MANGHIEVTMATCSYSEYSPKLGAAVRASRGAPKWFPYPYAFWEAPTPEWYMLKMEDQEKYRKSYLGKLDSVGVEEMLRQRDLILQDQAIRNQGVVPDTLVILCYEKLSMKGKWCHRTMFAEWWEEKTGERVIELGSHPVHEENPEPDYLF